MACGESVFFIGSWGVFFVTLTIVFVGWVRMFDVLSPSAIHAKMSTLFRAVYCSWVCLLGLVIAVPTYVLYFPRSPVGYC
jgi:hypothetical protein